MCKFHYKPSCLIIYAVTVALPWETNTLIPQGSTVRMNCTAESDHAALVWTITLPGREVLYQFTFEQSIRILNDHGFYELPGIEATIQLLINRTEGNNGTVVRCDDISSNIVISQTALIVYGKCAVYRPLMPHTDMIFIFL